MKLVGFFYFYLWWVLSVVENCGVPVKKKSERKRGSAVACERPGRVFPCSFVRIFCIGESCIKIGQLWLNICRLGLKGDCDVDFFSFFFVAPYSDPCIKIRVI